MKSDAINSAVLAVSAGATGCIGVTTGSYLVGSEPTLPVCSASPQSVIVRVIHDGTCDGSGFCDVIVNITGDATPPVFAAAPANVTVQTLALVPTMTTLAWTDNCDGATGSETGTDGALIGGTCGGTITRTWSVTDLCGNTGTATQIITVDDTMNPVATCPVTISDVMLDASGNGTLPANIGDGSSTDNSGTVTETSPSASFTCADVGIQTVVLTATDGCLNTNTISCSFNVVDNINPVAVCPATIANVVLDASGNGTLPANIGDGSSTDNCAGVIETSPSASFTCADVGVQTVVLTATDASGNMNTTVCSFNVVDNTNPVAVCPTAIANVVLDASGNGTLPANIGDGSSTDNCTGVVETSPSASFTCADVGVQTVVLTATDASGNMNTTICSFNVVDNAPPTVSVPTTNISIGNDPGMCSAIVNYSVPIFIDNCGSPLVTLSSGPVSGSTFLVGTTTTITYSATDVSGNGPTQSSFTITVNDTEAPTFASVPANATINTSEGGTGDCNGQYNWNHPTVMDNCVSVLTYTVTYNDADGNTVGPLAIGSGDAESREFPIGNNIVNYSVSDGINPPATSSFMITVQDDEAPAFNSASCPSGTTLSYLSCNSSGVTLPDYTGSLTVSDNCPGSFTIVQSPIAGTVLTSNTTVTLTIVDNNTVTSAQACSFLISVVDANNLTPTTAGINLPNATTDCGSEVAAPTATDGCGTTYYGIPNAPFTLGMTANTYIFDLPIPNPVTWSYSDLNGNSISQSQNISIIDNTSPTINCVFPTPTIHVVLNSVTGEATLNSSQLASTFTVNDNCGTPTILMNGVNSIPYSCSNVGFNFITVTARDASGNISSSCNAFVNVIDNVEPIFSNIPANISIDCNDMLPDPPVIGTGIDEIDATDVCGIFGNIIYNQNSFQLSDPSLSGHYNYEIQRTWTVSDVNGNSTTAIQSIFVQDNQAPMFFNDNGNGNSNFFFPYNTLPNPTVDSVINISAAQNSCNANLSLAITAADIIDSCTSFSQLQFQYYTYSNGLFTGADNTNDASGVYPIGISYVSFFVNDPSGNNSMEFLVQVNVTDNTPPIASCTNNIIVGIPAGQDSVIINPALIDNGSFDNCAGSNVQLDVFPSVFYCSQIADGTQEEFDITLAVSVLGSTDTSFCQTTIIIQDNNAPIITCPNPLVLSLGEDGTVTVTVDSLNNGVTDCSNIQSMTLTGPTTYTTADIGTHAYDPMDPNIPTLVVTDIHGNIGTCTPASVTVNPPRTCIASQNIISDGQVAIPYTATNFTNVIGFQFSIEVNKNNVAAFSMGDMANFCGTSLSNIPNLSGINDELICNGTFNNILSVTGDTLSISWFNTSPNPISVPDGEALFNVNIDALGVVGDSTYFSITNVPYSTELTTKYGNLIIEDNPALCLNLGYFKVGDNASLPISGNVSTWSRTRIDTMSIDTNFMVTPNTYTYNLDTVVLVAGQGLANANLVKIETMLPLLTNTPDTTDIDMTDANGDYSVQVSNVSGGIALDLTPRKNNPSWLNNGDVNSSDLFFIQQHIVNNIPFTSIYDYVAADVNQSGTITTLDLVLIQDVIVNTELAPVPSSVIEAYNPWRFIQKGYAEFVLDPYDLDPSILLPAQPMAPVIPASAQNRVYNPAVLPMADVDWIAVKVGQIFGGLNTSTLTTNDVDSRTGENFVMSVENQKVTNGDLISIPVYSKDYAAFIAWQFTLEFDENYLAFEGVTPGAIDGFQENKLGLNSVEEGIIGAVWYGMPNTVKSDEVLFTLQFTALDDADALSGLIDVTSRTVNSHSSLMSGATGEVSLEFFSPIATATTDFTLHQNRPNPFNAETLISFNLPEAGFARMTISDISGRTLKVIEGDFAKGYNEVIIQSNDLSSTGVLYYQLESAEHIATKKMIILN